MLITIPVLIEVPDEATHYYGDLLDDPIFLKLKSVAEQPHWFYYCVVRKGWYLDRSGQKHPWVREIPKT